MTVELRGDQPGVGQAIILDDEPVIVPAKDMQALEGRERGMRRP